MKSKPNPLLIGIGLIILITLIWWFSNNDNSNDSEIDSNSKNMKQMSVDDDQPAAPLEPTMAMPTYVDTSEKQKEFSQKIQNLVNATAACQKEIETLFPVEELEGASKTYKNLAKFKVAIQKFYQVVNKRIEKSQELMNFLETLPDSEIPAERLFSQLSSIEDCGEFEEEAILDQAMTTALELKWPLDQKRELTNTILDLFEKQLSGNIGLHQISAKIEVLHSLADDGFISSKFNPDLLALDQVMDSAESDFRQSLPGDFAQKRIPTLKDINDIKRAEQEIITEKLKPPFLDTISSLKGQ